LPETTPLKINPYRFALTPGEGNEVVTIPEKTISVVAKNEFVMKGPT
jgi:hypothetical protein